MEWEYGAFSSPGQVMDMRHTATIGAKGQIVIPVDVRRELGLEPGQRVSVVVRDGRLFLLPLPDDLIGALTGCLEGHRSLTEELVREHAEEVRQDEARVRRTAVAA